MLFRRVPSFPDGEKRLTEGDLKAGLVEDRRIEDFYVCLWFADRVFHVRAMKVPQFETLVSKSFRTLREAQQCFDRCHIASRLPTDENEYTVRSARLNSAIDQIDEVLLAIEQRDGVLHGHDASMLEYVQQRLRLHMERVAAIRATEVKPHAQRSDPHPLIAKLKSGSAAS